ncbi:MAG: hypothetical protein HYY84_10745 [Deltaproteobacteria bacterium]|nr:hypothetical protein [Deltaproteobacteria bacterium]
MVSLSFLFLFCSCAGDRPQGIAPAEDGPGPKVVFDLTARPLPEIPFPNDLATRVDPTSPTGRRLNISQIAPTDLERQVRKHANSLEGFGTYSGLSVRFDAPLDLANIARRHQTNRDVADDTVVVLCLKRGAACFGKPVPLDLGNGNFPLTVSRMDAYFDNDPRAHVPNLLLDTTREDKNGNGVLDFGEDTDDDGILDTPNLVAPGMGRVISRPTSVSDVDSLATYYETATNTLLVRPVLPLDEETTYAVVLTKNLIGADGNPARSPFAFVNHARQTDALRPLGDALTAAGLSLNDVAFAWSFTTQGPTRDLDALRRGLYGVGPFKRLAKEFPADVTVFKTVDTGANLYTLPTKTFLPVLRILASSLGESPDGVNAIVKSYDNVDYFIVGEVEGPNLLVDRDGHAAPGFPADNDEVWDLNRATGHAVYGRHKVPFWCAVPKKDRGAGAPFPVGFYAHGYGSSRFELLGFAGNVARYGIAACTVEAFGHGLAIPRGLAPVVAGLFSQYGISPMRELLSPGRARDLDNDGEVDSGGDFWTADVFHTRDAVRQTILDTMVVIRAFRNFDGTRRLSQDLLARGAPDLAGDFNGDGIVDLGGPNIDYFTWGSSLGGILSSILAGIEPAITAAAPVSGGAGLADIGIRSSLGGVYDAVILPLMGPIFVGQKGDLPGEIVVSTIVPTANRRKKMEVFRTQKIAKGDIVKIENPVAEKSYVAIAGDDGAFRVHIAADALDPIEKRVKLGFRPAASGEPLFRVPDTTALGDRLVIRVFDPTTGLEKAAFDKFGVDVDHDGVTYPAGQPLIALARGSGLQRNTPNFRRFMNIAQTVLEPADPVNYAPRYFKNPIPSQDYDTAEPGSNVVVIVTAGDTIVPAATGIAIARAAGIISLDTIDPRYGKTPNDVIIDNYAVEGLSWLKRFDGKRVVIDLENFSDGRHAPEVPRLDPPLRLTVETPKGLQALRVPLLDPRGQHVFGLPEPTSAFDNPTFLVHMVANFFASRGRELKSDVCMAKENCAWMPAPSPPTP